MSDIPLGDIAYQAIRQKLLNAEYVPGDLLSESELAGALKMSRTPIRTAIDRLEKEGFLETLKKRGVLVKELNFNELFDIFDLMNAMHMYVIQIIEQEQYEMDLEEMKRCLDALVLASEEKRYRDYYENGLLLMRSLLATIHNRCFLDTFNMYKDKILFFVVATRSTRRQNQPYTGKKLYTEIYEALAARNFEQAKKAIQESKTKSREELVRSGIL